MSTIVRKRKDITIQTPYTAMVRWKITRHQLERKAQRSKGEKEINKRQLARGK